MELEHTLQFSVRGKDRNELYERIDALLKDYSEIQPVKMIINSDVQLIEEGMGHKLYSLFKAKVAVWYPTS